MNKETKTDLVHISVVYTGHDPSIDNQIIELVGKYLEGTGYYFPEQQRDLLFEVDIAKVKSVTESLSSAGFEYAFINPYHEGSVQ